MTTPSDDRNPTTAFDPAEVEARLDAEAARLEAELADVLHAGSLGDPGSDGSDRELSSADQHPADDATNVQNREQDLAEMESFRAQLAEIEGARARLADGSYGRCLACGQPIGAERLEALPAAAYCIDDQRQAEEVAIRPL
jgi:RNA polymerase-binding transcription factor DksA